MNKYEEAFNSLVLMLSGGLRTEYLGNEQIKKDLETLKELIDNYKELANEKCMRCGDYQIITSIEPPTILCKAKGCKWYGK